MAKLKLSPAYEPKEQYKIEVVADLSWGYDGGAHIEYSDMINATEENAEKIADLLEFIKDDTFDHGQLHKLDDEFIAELDEKLMNISEEIPAPTAGKSIDLTYAITFNIYVTYYDIDLTYAITFNIYVTYYDAEGKPFNVELAKE